MTHPRHQTRAAIRQPDPFTLSQEDADMIRSPQMHLNAAILRAEQRQSRLRLACILIAAAITLTAAAMIGTHAAEAALAQAEAMRGM